MPDCLIDNRPADSLNPEYEVQNFAVIVFQVLPRLSAVGFQKYSEDILLARAYFVILEIGNKSLGTRVTALAVEQHIIKYIDSTYEAVELFLEMVYRERIIPHTQKRKESTQSQSGRKCHKRKRSDPSQIMASIDDDVEDNERKTREDYERATLLPRGQALLRIRRLFRWLVAVGRSTVRRGLKNSQNNWIWPIYPL